MPDPVTCTSCRSPIDVPADHAENTIRCGICWSENVLFAKPTPAAPAKAVARPVAQILPPKPARPTTVTAIPAKAASGTAKLEGLIQRAAVKLAPPAAPVVPAQALPIVATVKPLAAEVVPVAAKPTAPPVAAAPVPIPQAPVPTPVRVAPSGPPVVVHPVPVAAAPPTAPVVVPTLPVEAPVAVTVAPLPAAPAVVPHQPVLDAEPVVQGEFADGEPKRAAKGERSKATTKRRPRDDDDDDFDDRRRPRKRDANNGSMVMMIVAGGAFLVLVCVGGYYLVRSLGGSKSPDANPAGNNLPVANADQPPQPQMQFNLPNPDGGPQGNPNGNFGFNPFPQMPAFEPPRPKVNVNWVEHDGDGFKAKLVERPTTHNSLLRLTDDRFHPVHARSKQVSARTFPPAVTVEVVTADAPQGVVPDLKRLAAEPFGRADNVKACKVAGHDGFEHVEALGQRATTTRCVQVGCRVFVFKLTAMPPFGDKETIETATKTFWESVSITFDPATPAPADPNLMPKNPNPFPPRPNPRPPAFPNGEVPGVVVPPARGPAGDEDTLKLAVRIDPFIAAVVFPDRGEAYTVAARPGTRTAGELRRYEYPDFKLKNTYFLPAAGTFAVGSDKTNRLAITTIVKTDGYADGERSMVIGDVHVFDLKPIFEDKVAQREELKPYATVPQPNTRLVGLEMSPDGKSIYFLGLGRGPTPFKPGKTRLTHVDVESGKTINTLDLPDPAWRTRLSPDGKKLYAAEVPVSGIGAPNVVPNRATNVVTVDVGRWLIERTDQLPGGTAFDFVALPKGVLVASVPGGASGYTLHSLAPPDKAVPLDGPGEEAISRGYVAATADGRRLVTAGVGRAGPFDGNVAVYDVTDWKNASGFKKVASNRSRKTQVLPDNPIPRLNGNFDLTPDGKFALFGGSGVVVDLTAVGR